MCEFRFFFWITKGKLIALSSYYIVIRYKKNNPSFLIVTNQGRLLFSRTLKQLKFKGKVTLNKEILATIIKHMGILLKSRQIVSYLLKIEGSLPLPLLVVFLTLLSKLGLIIIGTLFPVFVPFNGVKFVSKKN
jgi:hypothetical protein